jgi:hypothetical protein
LQLLTQSPRPLDAADRRPPSGKRIRRLAVQWYCDACQ